MNWNRLTDVIETAVRLLPEKELRRFAVAAIAPVLPMVKNPAVLALYIRRVLRGNDLIDDLPILLLGDFHDCLTQETDHTLLGKAAAEAHMTAQAEMAVCHVSMCYASIEGLRNSVSYALKSSEMAVQCEILIAETPREYDNVSWPEKESELRELQSSLFFMAKKCVQADRMHWLKRNYRELLTTLAFKESHPSRISK